MEKYVAKPDITFNLGIKVDEKTELTYKNDFIVQDLKKLKLHSKAKTYVKEALRPYKISKEVTLELEKGDILLFEEDRGYFFPNDNYCEPKEAMEDFKNIM